MIATTFRSTRGTLILFYIFFLNNSEKSSSNSEIATHLSDARNDNL